MKIHRILFSLLVVFTMSSCTLIDLEDPVKGKITLITDWSKRAAGVQQPDGYTVVINNQTLTFSSTTNQLPSFSAGLYPVRIYNTPDKINVDGSIATVAVTENAVDPLPGWLFTAVREVEYTDFGEETVTVVMQQQVRKLTIILKSENGSASRIANITAYLSGVVGAWDFEANQPSGGAVNIPLIFAKQIDGTWQSSVRLLGTTGSQQRLTGLVAFEAGSPTDMPLDSDLSASLAGFNFDKRTPLLLQGEMEETATELGFVGLISSWELGNGGGESGNAE